MDISDLQALLGEDVGAPEHRDVWVLGLDGLASTCLGEARRLADSLGAYVHYVGPAASAEAVACGADRTYRLNAYDGQEIVAAVAELWVSAPPEIVLVPASCLGDEVAGRLAQRLGSGALYNCISLQLDESARVITGTYPVYDGAYYLDVAVTARPGIFTLAPDRFPQPYQDPGRSGEQVAEIAPSAAGEVTSLGPVDLDRPAPTLRKARRVVAVGRTGNTTESVDAARKLAERLGAQFAGDRSAFDSGWITQDQIVGVVGTEIAPDLYIAAGIWGDTLHRVGVEGAGCVIAIHPDKNAPIFSYADACIVGQPHEILPDLLAHLT